MPTGVYKRIKPPWNKGTKGICKSNSGSFRKGHIPAHAGKKRLETSGEKHWNWKGGWRNKLLKCLVCGKQLSRKDARYCRLHTPLGQKGENHYSWKGGITPINEKIRKSLKYRNWRKAIFKRDNFTCTNCGIRGGKIVADHIKPFCDYPELRFELSNGRTLCINCDNKIGWNLFRERNPKYA